MAKGARKGVNKSGEQPGGVLAVWLAQSPSLALGLFCTLPLWVIYEAAQNFSAATLPRNGAEVAVYAIFGAMGKYGTPCLRMITGSLVLGAGFLLLRRKVPLFKLGPLVIAEGLIWGCLIGPLGLLLSQQLVLGPQSFWPEGIYCSMGAGLYEELVFRLFLLSLLHLVFSRALAFHEVPKWVGTVAAVLISAFLFALAHHLSPASAAIDPWVLLFRTVMGGLLGALFVTRGFGVVVYAHTCYDIIFYFSQSI